MGADRIGHQRREHGFRPALNAPAIPLPGGGTAVYNGSGLNYIRHTDWLGSSRLATTWAHAVYSKEAYAPFGETYNEAGTGDRSFTGQDQDVVTGSGATGVYDYLFRKYDPSAGRWLSPDPAGWQAVSLHDPQSFDRYAYVENQPMSATDPDGQMWCISADNKIAKQMESCGNGWHKNSETVNVNDSGPEVDMSGGSFPSGGSGGGGFGGGGSGSGGSGGGGGAPNNGPPGLTPQQQHQMICATMAKVSNAAAGMAKATAVVGVAAVGVTVLTGGAAAPVASGFGVGAAGFQTVSLVNTAVARWAMGCSNNTW